MRHSTRDDVARADVQFMAFEPSAIDVVALPYSNECAEILSAGNLTSVHVALIKVATVLLVKGVKS
jgi:hypothetical protein